MELMNSGMSFLTMALDSRVFLLKTVLRCHNSEVSISVNEPLVITEAMTPSHAPLDITWYRRTYDYSRLLVAVALNDRVSLISIDGESSENSAYDVPIELPDFLGGFCFSEGLETNTLELDIGSVNGILARLKVNLKSLQSSIIIEITSYSLEKGHARNIRSTEVDGLKTRDWISPLIEARRHFVERYKITQAICRIFGIAVSPFGGYVAVIYRLASTILHCDRMLTVHSIKPQGYMEYLVQVDKRCYLSFGMRQEWEKVLEREEYGSSSACLRAYIIWSS